MSDEINYDKTVTDLVKAIKQDKSIIQPWRNKAVARLEEAQAFVRMGKTSAYETTTQFTINTDVIAQCTCPNGATDLTCPVHGDSNA